ncbi:hypothetical protein RUM44_001376 [Polyplax serrata]|uniref:Uncharacterized protein n=1 Tax=Polyplax serrata TaxID=468196 RepID=A0ABR1AJU8_POLSC
MAEFHKGPPPAKANGYPLADIHVLRHFVARSPVIGGGSTTVEGPKNDGISPEVVTGVLRSPCCGSGAAGSVLADSPEAAGTGLPPGGPLGVPLYRHVSKLRTLKAAVSESRRAECGRCGGSVSKPSMVMVGGEVAAGTPSTQPQELISWGRKGLRAPAEGDGASDLGLVAGAADVWHAISLSRGSGAVMM